MVQRWQQVPGTSLELTKYKIGRTMCTFGHHFTVHFISYLLKVYVLQMCVYFNKPYSLPFPEGERAPWIQKAGMEVMVRQEKRRITRGRWYNLKQGGLRSLWASNDLGHEAKICKLNKVSEVNRDHFQTSLFLFMMQETTDFTN